MAAVLSARRSLVLSTSRRESCTACFALARRSAASSEKEPASCSSAPRCCSGQTFGSSSRWERAASPPTSRCSRCTRSPRSRSSAMSTAPDCPCPAGSGNSAAQTGANAAVRQPGDSGSNPAARANEQADARVTERGANLPSPGRTAPTAVSEAAQAAAPAPRIRRAFKRAPSWQRGPPVLGLWPCLHCGPCAASPLKARSMGVS